MKRLLAICSVFGVVGYFMGKCFMGGVNGVLKAIDGMVGPKKW